MAVMLAVDWLSARLRLGEPGYWALLGYLLRRPEYYVNDIVMRGFIPENLGEYIKHDSTLFSDIAKIGRRRVEAFLDSMPLEQRGILLRCVVSLEILRNAGEGRIADERLMRWLERVMSGLRGCRLDSIRCLLEELSGNPSYLEKLLYGLARLRDMALAEKSVDFFDYSVVVLSLAKIDSSVAEALAEDLESYFDSGNLLASELAYHVYWTLAFYHEALPGRQREVLERAYYSPDAVVACRAKQILEGERDAERIDEWDVKPCLVRASYKGNDNLYVLV